MKKPRITIYKIDGQYLAYNKDIQKFYQGLFTINLIFRWLSIIYILQKDNNGMYLNLPLDKPVFD